MKFDFESLSAEPLFYMLMHSGVFVSVLGGVFFIIGLIFGHATWGRYKRQTRELRGEAAAMKDEIAQLKRKIGDQSVKSGQSISIATETIHMPAKEDAVAQVPDAPAPAVPPAAPSQRSSTKNRLSRPARANTIKPKAVAVEAAAPVVAKSETTATASPTAAKSVTSIPPSPAADTSSPPAPARHISPLAAIASAPPPEKKEHGTDDKNRTVSTDFVPAEAIPALSGELPPASAPAAIAQPVLDSRLGLIYKTKPEKTDDLTALKGIARMLEQRLHEYGVYTYAQIASWSEDQIKEFSARLAFKDRIQRERWVEQAQQLLAQNAPKVA